MRNLFIFLYRFRAFLLFVLLEVLCIFLIVRYNTYQGAAFFNSASTYVGRVLEYQNSITDYFRLASVNTSLAEENAALKQEIMRYKTAAVSDSIAAMDTTFFEETDTSKVAPYFLHASRIINNSIRRTNNYLTLAAGSKDGIKPGMGVIAPNGVVGRVKTVSRDYATVTSLLHSQMLISAKLKNTDTFGTIRWQGGDYRQARLEYIPLHVKLAVGDTVVTSGYNTVFPEGILIGTVSSVEKEQDNSFFTIYVKLAVDFAQLSYVYVVEDPNRAQREELEDNAGIIPNE